MENTSTNLKNEVIEEPLDVIKIAVKYLAPGTVCDLGCGTGRNALYLAQHGFAVTGIDISEDAILKLESRTRSLELNNITGLVMNIREYSFLNNFNNFVCTHALQNLKEMGFYRVINQIKSHTVDSGINVISAFINQGEMYEVAKEQGGYWLTPDELKSIYSDWDVLFYEEIEMRSSALDKDGQPYMQMSANIIARKI